ncbi:hypothetical protein MMC11_008811, partial [Xylographa trunciseda]|nr:hypothetical protein [Xylographa trunciseda]
RDCDGANCSTRRASQIPRGTASVDHAPQHGKLSRQYESRSHVRPRWTRQSEGGQLAHPHHRAGSSVDPGPSVRPEPVGDVDAPGLLPRNVVSPHSRHRSRRRGRIGAGQRVRQRRCGGHVHGRHGPRLRRKLRRVYVCAGRPGEANRHPGSVGSARRAPGAAPGSLGLAVHGSATAPGRPFADPRRHHLRRPRGRRACQRPMRIYRGDDAQRRPRGLPRLKRRQRRLHRQRIPCRGGPEAASRRVQQGARPGGPGEPEGHVPVRRPVRRRLRDGRRGRKMGDGELRPVRGDSEFGALDQLLRQRGCLHQDTRRRDRAADRGGDVDHPDQGVPLGGDSRGSSRHGGEHGLRQNRCLDV